MPWGDINQGTTEVGGRDVEVTFNEKTDSDGNTTDVLVSNGLNDRATHDANHGHAWGQNTDNPGHQDRGNGVFDDHGYSDD